MRAVTLDRPAPETARRAAVPVRERRPGLAALGAVLILGGALGGALVVHRSGDRSEVLVVTRDIAPGARIGADDLGVARVAADGASLVPAASLGSFVGGYASTRIPAGTLLNPAMTLAGDAVPTGAAVVGVVLGDAQRPSSPLAVGDVVGVYLVGADGSASGAVPTTGSGVPGDVLVDAARVVGVGAGQDSASAAGLTTAPDAVSLLVTAADTADVVAAAAAGQVALVRLAGSTIPAVDLLAAG